MNQDRGGATLRKDDGRSFQNARERRGKCTRSSGVAESHFLSSQEDLARGRADTIPRNGRLSWSHVAAVPRKLDTGILSWSRGAARPWRFLVLEISVLPCHSSLLFYWYKKLQGRASVLLSETISWCWWAYCGRGVGRTKTICWSWSELTCEQFFSDHRQRTARWCKLSRRRVERSEVRMRYSG